MIIKRFLAKNLHGYLDFEVSFNERLSFLTGINGSGKTTVLNCIQALLLPDLSLLQGLKFNIIKLVFMDDSEKTYSVEASQTESSIKITLGNVSAPFEYNRYIPEPSIPTSRQYEGEMEYFRDLVATSMNHPVMAFISQLPTPMFLGLDRRAKLAADERRPGMMYRPRYAPHRQPMRGMLGTSLNEAEEIVVEAYRDARISSGKVSEELQRQLILNLITPSSDTDSGLELPTTDEKRVLTRVKSDLDLFPLIFRLPAADVNKRVKPFIAHLEEIIENFPKGADISKDFNTTGEVPPYFDNLIKWSSNKSQLKKISFISQTVSSFNEKQANALKPFESYKSLVNAFLQDSGKSIDIGADGRSIAVKIRGVKAAQPLSALSSGEAQIFVILTNLAFSPSTQRTNVFIIDEPELSLHVRWQEMFVDSVLAVNSKTQFIMATHSPSIILERTSECIDVVAKGRRSHRA